MPVLMLKVQEVYFYTLNRDEKGSMSLGLQNPTVLSTPIRVCVNKPMTGLRQLVVIIDVIPITSRRRLIELSELYLQYL